MTAVTDNGEAGDRRLIGLGEAFAFILPLAGSKQFAGEILLRILQDGAATDDGGPPRFTLGSIEGMPMFQAPSPFDGRFWWPDARDGERIEFNPVNGTASWHGPRRFRGNTPRDFMVMEAMRYNGKLPPVHIQMLGIRVRHDVVLAHLRFRSLWPPATLQVEKPSSMPDTTASASPSQSTAAKRKRLGVQEERIIAAGRLIYGGDDWPMLRPAELQRAIDTALKAGTLKTVPPLPKHWVAPLGSCTSVLAKQRKLQSN